MYTQLCSFVCPQLPVWASVYPRKILSWPKHWCNPWACSCKCVKCLWEQVENDLSLWLHSSSGVTTASFWCVTCVHLQKYFQNHRIFWVGWTHEDHWSNSWVNGPHRDWACDLDVMSTMLWPAGAIYSAFCLDFSPQMDPLLMFHRFWVVCKAARTTVVYNSVNGKKQTSRVYWNVNHLSQFF